MLFLNAFESFVKVINVLARTSSVINASKTIHRNLNSPHQLSQAEIVNTTAQTVFVLTEAGNVIGNDLGLIPKEKMHASLGLRAGAAVTDVARQVIDVSTSDREWNKEQVLDILGTASYRAGDLALFAAEKHPSVFGGHEKQASAAGNVLCTLATAIAHREPSDNDGPDPVDLFAPPNLGIEQ